MKNQRTMYVIFSINLSCSFLSFYIKLESIAFFKSSFTASNFF